MQDYPALNNHEEHEEIKRSRRSDHLRGLRGTEKQIVYLESSVFKSVYLRSLRLCSEALRIEIDCFAADDKNDPFGNIRYAIAHSL
jgi:hypothetical protein